MWCLLLWSFLPDGPLRSAVLIMATVSWIMSLFVNLNAMSRFDGYFILSDMLGLPNLQSRSFDYMRYTLRKLLFGRHEDPPEFFSAGKATLVLAIGVFTTVYRFMLNVAIALLVYHFFIKALGILMFAAEVLFFFLMPVWRELKVWWSMRKSISRSWRSYLSSSLAILGLTTCFVPLSRHVEVPAQLEPERYQRLFPQASGQIADIAVRNGATIKTGDPLFVIVAPDTVMRKRVAEAELKANTLRLERIAVDSKDLVENQVIRRDIAQLIAEIHGLEEQERRLTIRAPFDGVLTDMPDHIYEGSWVSRHVQLGLVVGGNKTVSSGFITADDVRRVSPGASAIFVPDNIASPAIDMRLTYVAASNADVINLEALTSVHGGQIAVLSDSSQRLVPVNSQFAVRSESVENIHIPAAMNRGILKLAASPESIASRVARQIMRVLVRESGA